MVSSKLVVNQYPQQHYSTLFNQQTGLFIRIEDKGYAEPSWCPYGPELVDISITNWCDHGCAFCYKGSTPHGQHMRLGDYICILRQLAKIKVSQVALGGGNPNQHPDFCEILRLTREDFDIVPSYTTNGRGLTKDVLNASKAYCGAVAVSAYPPYIETIDAIRALSEFGVKVNVHFLLTAQSIETAIEWLQSPHPVFENVNAIIFLNYKPVGKSRRQHTKLYPGSSQIKRFFDIVTQQHNLKFGFDSCSVSGVAKYMTVNPVSLESCESAKFSMYISEDMKMYPCSFMIEDYPGIQVKEDNIQLEWQCNKTFTSLRNFENESISCACCASKGICKGGCPIFPEINLCAQTRTKHDE